MAAQTDAVGDDGGRKRRFATDVVRSSFGADVLISKKQLAIDSAEFIALLQQRTPGLAAPKAAHGT